MDAFGLVISAVCLLNPIYQVESVSCYKEPCTFQGNPGCRKLLKDITILEEDCCNGNRHGFYPYSEELGNGCYTCDTCSDYFGKIDGGWSDWSEWTKCTKRCGGGKRERSRQCDNPVPMGLGKDCDGKAEEEEACNTHSCPVDGEWSAWSQWSSCSVTCGHGEIVRRRKCDNPSPKHGGKKCPGDDTYKRRCTLNDCPIDGGWSKWSHWSRCSVSCGGGERSRKRECNNPRPQHGGKACKGSKFENENCNDEPCPVDGKWSKWSEWSECSVTCGAGKQIRQRSCTNPRPKHGGKRCQGLDADSQYCNPRHCPINGGWSVWSKWSGCSTTCGNGTMTQKRTCTNPEPKYGGKRCPGESTKYKSCNEDPCPVNGQWGEWSAWGSCLAKDCNDLKKGGTQIKTRMCDNPPPMYGGKMCKGRFVEKFFCSDPPDNCPVNGGWSDWSPWICKDCMAVIRTRNCSNPFPKLGGKNCAGTSFQNKGKGDDLFKKHCFEECKPVTVTKRPEGTTKACDMYGDEVDCGSGNGGYGKNDMYDEEDKEEEDDYGKQEERN